jgi:hypothetical protein
MKILPYILVLCGALLAGALIGWSLRGSQEPLVILSFEDCAAAGYPVAESYPRQCRAGDKLFVEDIGNELEKADLIRASTPRPNQMISSPLSIEGEARGFWFFEASFPIELVDENGATIAFHYIMTAADWMNEDFVPFSGQLEFDAAHLTGAKGTLILHKDNPSGLPQHNSSLRIPVRF